jgi:Tfp pilus assembly protein FimT
MACTRWTPRYITGMTHQVLTVNSQSTIRRTGAGAAGYSLVTVLLSLQITIVVGLIAVPKLGTYMAGYRLTGASNQLGFEINRARMQAVGQNKNVRIIILDGTRYARQTNSSGETWTTERETTLPSGLTASPTDGKIQFDKRGMATVNSTITLTNSVQQVKTVTTNVLGRVTVG